jgi:hypothetical protein
LSGRAALAPPPGKWYDPRLGIRAMGLDEALMQVPLDGLSMRLRRTELAAVATGIGAFETPVEGEPNTLAAALRRLPSGDRAPTWELAVRRYGQHKPLPQAAGEIGLDAVHARELLARFAHLLAEVAPPEHRGRPPVGPQRSGKPEGQG